MPNIQKLKDKGKIDKILDLLNHNKLEIQIEAINALIELEKFDYLIDAINKRKDVVRFVIIEYLKNVDDITVKEALKHVLINDLKYGEFEEKIKAITLIRGRAVEAIVLFHIIDEKILNLVKTKMRLEIYRDPLIELIGVEKNPFVIWLCMIALIELGDTRDEVLEEFIKISSKYYQYLKDDSARSNGSIFSYIIAGCVFREIMRSLSYFKNNKLAVNSVVSAIKNDFLPEHGSNIECIYALGALGDPDELDRLNYMKNSADKDLTKAIEIALEYYGKATYDQIMAKVKNTESVAASSHFF